MTAPEPSADVQPGHDGECTCGEFAGTSVRYADCPVHSPAAPSEPPAEAQPIDEIRNSYRAAEITGSVPLRRVITAALDEAEARGRRGVARPSADTETLRQVLDGLEAEESDPDAPTSAERRAGWHAALSAVRAALDGGR